MKKAVIYARVSTTKQAEEGLSINAQTKQLQEYATENGYEIVEEYVDRGASAKTADRPAFQDMISTIKSAPEDYDAVLIHKTDRFARNREDSIVYKSLLRRDCNVDVIAIKEDFGDGPIGSLVEGMLEVVAEFYSKNLAKEVVKGQSERAKLGKALGEPPYGYKIDPATEKYTPCKEAKVVKYIFDMYEKGNGLREISIDIRKNGAKLFGEAAIQKKSKAVKGKGDHQAQKLTLAPKTIRNMLEKEVYVGTYTWDDIIIENNHPAIINKKQFKLVQDLLNRNSRSKKNTSKDYLLKGLVTCIECGGNLSQLTQRYTPVGSDEEQIRRKLRCSNHTRLKNCYPNYWDMEEVEQALIDYLKDIIEDNVDISQLQIKKINNNKTVKELNQLKKKYSSIDERFDKQMEAFEAGVIDLRQLQGYKERLNKEKEEIEDRIKKLEDNINSTTTDKESFKEKLNKLVNTLEDKDIPLNSKKNLLLQTISEVQLSKRKELMKVIFKA